MSPGKRNGPDGGNGPLRDSAAAKRTGAARVTATPDMLRERRAASMRLMPLVDERRDVLDPLPAPPRPSTFALTVPELRAEARRLHRLGWTRDELHTRLDLGGAA